MASNILNAQWSESDVVAMFDSGHVHSGNVRGLVVHMKTHRLNIKADQTIYFYTRLRKDHIVMNGGEYGETLGSSDISALSSSSSSTKAKEREKEKDALSNPTHIVLAEFLKKSLLKDRPIVCAVFRYADQLLGREDEVLPPSDRKTHPAHKGTVPRKIPVQGPSSGSLVASSSSSSSSHDRHVDAGSSSGSGSGSSCSYYDGASNKNHADPNRPCSSGNGSGNSSGGFTNGIEVDMDGSNGSSNPVMRNRKRPVPILSPLGIINENPPPVDMTDFLRIFLNKSKETSVKRPRAD
jgi:hypothetical protein